MTSGLYKIEGKNEVAYFRANLDQLRQYLLTDSKWALRVMGSPGSFEFLEQMYDRTGALGSIERVRLMKHGSKLVEQGEHYFVVRGNSKLYFRIEAVDPSTSRIVPDGRLSRYEKSIVTTGLLWQCIFPIVLAPVIIGMKKRLNKVNAQQHLETFCKYLEMRHRELNAQILRRS